MASKKESCIENINSKSPLNPVSTALQSWVGSLSTALQSLVGPVSTALQSPLVPQVTDSRGLPGYDKVCAVADELTVAPTPFSEVDVQQLCLLGRQLHQVDREMAFVAPAPSLLATKYRSSKKSSVTPGVDSTKK